MRRLKFLFVMLLCVSCVSSVSALQLVVTPQLNQTVKVQEGELTPTTLTFQINNTESYPISLTVFARTETPSIVTISKSVEILRHFDASPGMNNVSFGVRGVRLGNGLVSYGYYIDEREPLLYNREPYSSLPLGTRVVNLSVETDKLNTHCRYSTKPDIQYKNMFNSMIDDDHSHSSTVRVQDNTSYSFYVRCMHEVNSSQLNMSTVNISVTCPRVNWCSEGNPAVDTVIDSKYMNVNSQDYLINFTVGNVYPVIVPPVVKNTSINFTLIVPDPVVPDPVTPPPKENIVKEPVANVSVPIIPPDTLANSDLVGSFDTPSVLNSTVSVVNNSVSNISVVTNQHPNNFYSIAFLCSTVLFGLCCIVFAIYYVRWKNSN